MPKETPQRVRQGPGSAAPTFTPPTTPVATPSFAQRDQPSEFAQFRDAVVSAGRGAASALRARANINTQIRNIKERGVREVERILKRDERMLMEQRATDAEDTRREILLEAEQKGPDWVEREFRSRMLNAGSREEANFWEAAWTPAAKAVDRRNDEQQRQEFNSAVRSVDRITTALNSEVESDPRVKAVLMGDGQNITNRVQDWMMLKIREADPTAFDLEEGATEDQKRSRDMLIHQVMKQAYGISDRLIAANNKRTEKSNEILAGQQLEADIFATVTGEQDPSMLQAQLEVTLRDRMGHMTVEQQRSQLRNLATGSLDALGDGAYGIDALDKIGTASTILNMVIDGEPLFSPAEKARAAVSLLTKAENTAKREMLSAIGKLRESQTVPVTLPDGTTTFRPDPNADATLTTPDPITGITPIDSAANKVLREMGLLGADDLTPEGQAIVTTVRAEARKIFTATQSSRVRQALSIANHDTVFTGERGGDANEAHNMSMPTRSHMSPRALQAAKVPPLSGPEMASYKSELANIAQAMGVDPKVVRNWDGSNMEYTDDNRKLNQVAAVAEAKQWSGGLRLDPRTGELVELDVQSQYGMPSVLVKDKLSLLKSDDTNKLEAFGHWVEALDAGSGEAWDNFLAADGVTSQEAAAAQWMRMNMRLNRPRFSGDQVLPGDFQTAMPVLLQETQAILRSRPVGEWLGGDTGLEDVDRSNAANFGEVMAEIVSDQAKIEGDDKDRFGRRITAQFQSLFLSESDHTGRVLRNLWFAARAAEPDLTDGQRGAMIWSWVQQNGYRWREVNDRQILVIDPQGYTGEQGESVQERVDNSMNREFSPLYRSFLQEALGITDPFLTPRNMQDMFALDTAAAGQLDANAKIIRGRWNMAGQTTDRLLESRANYGGFVIEGQDEGGNPLPVPISVKDTLIRWPDGSSFMVPKNTILSVINPDLFAPPRRVPRARQALTLRGLQPTSQP